MWSSAWATLWNSDDAYEQLDQPSIDQHGLAKSEPNHNQFNVFDVGERCIQYVLQVSMLYTHARD